MIDPWKFNPLSDLGKKTRESSEIPYTREAISMTPKIKSEVKRIREEVKKGNKKLIDNSNELFL